jgi:hypothetical protein
VQQGGQERAIASCEPDSLVSGLTFEHHDLMPQREDLSVRLPIAHGEQT